jgi:hypothetical protein
LEIEWLEFSLTTELKMVVPILVHIEYEIPMGRDLTEIANKTKLIIAKKQL